MSVTVIDARCGNIGSIGFAFERLGADVTMTSDPAVIAKAERVVLPGVAAAGFIMGRLRELDLVEPIRNIQVPFLGICLGMQLLFEESEEDGGVPCLGMIPGKVRRIPDAPDRPVPHMGWSKLSFRRPDPLTDGMTDGDYVYFAHSFACDDGPATLAAAEYGQPIPASVRQGNVMGCQFHPERSAKVGARFLANFLSL